MEGCAEYYSFGKVKQAAVLVGLFERPNRDLEVLLTTRAKTMRRHPSQTALPGGKVDEEDESAYHTAVSCHGHIWKRMLMYEAERSV